MHWQLRNEAEKYIETEIKSTESTYVWTHVHVSVLRSQVYKRVYEKKAWNHFNSTCNFYPQDNWATSILVQMA